MKRNFSILCCLMIGLLISGCGPGQLFGPTLTPTPTPTLTPTPTPTLTPTPTPTLTPTPTPTLTPTPTPACLASNGTWRSHEEVAGLLSILKFDVQNCVITSWTLNEPLSDAAWLMWLGESIVPITNDQFTLNKDTNTGVITLEGFFDSSTSSHGTIKLPDGRTILWTASLSVP